MCNVHGQFLFFRIFSPPFVAFDGPSLCKLTAEHLHQSWNQYLCHRLYALRTSTVKAIIVALYSKLLFFFFADHLAGFPTNPVAPYVLPTHAKVHASSPAVTRRHRATLLETRAGQRQVIHVSGIQGNVRVQLESAYVYAAQLWALQAHTVI
jgi:hypothetical protein